MNLETLYGKAIRWCTWQDVVRTFFENLEEKIEIPIYDIPLQQRMTAH